MAEVARLVSSDVPIRKACRMVGLNRSTFMNRLTSANLSEFKSNYPPA